MFTPRQVKLKRPSEPTDPAEQNGPPAKSIRCRHNVAATNFNSEQVEQVLFALGMIFSEFAYSDKDSVDWMKNHERTVDGETGYIHLSALIDHPLLALKATVTQPLLRQAIDTRPLHSLQWLQSTNDHYYLRRNPLYLPSSKPHLFTSSISETGHPLDSQIIYVEPHLATMCRHPARVAQWITRHGSLREALLPVQHIFAPQHAYAFVVLSRELSSTEVNQSQEGNNCWPKGWIVMPKAVHAQRTAEYASLLGFAPLRPLP